MAGRGPGVGQVGQGAGGQVVDHVDGVALGQEPVDQGRADEAGPAGDQRAHGQTPATIRSPSMTVPDAVTAPAPITERAWITHRWPTMAPGPITEPSTVALDATRAPGRSTEPTTEAPFFDHRAGPDHRLLDHRPVRHRRPRPEERSGHRGPGHVDLTDPPHPVADGRVELGPGGGGPGRWPEDEVAVGPEVGVGGAGVQPVGVRALGEQGARARPWPGTSPARSRPGRRRGSGPAPRARRRRCRR